MSGQAKRISTAVLGAMLAIMIGQDNPALAYTAGVVATWISYRIGDA